MARGIVKGGLNNGGSNIKSVQSGFITYSGTSMDIAISAVDLTKSIVIIDYVGNSVGGVDSKAVAGKLTSSTNLNLSTYASSGGHKVTWTVVEFNNVKSLQKGSYSWATTTHTSEISKNLTINGVDLNKSLVFVSSKINYNSVNHHLLRCMAYLSNSTTLTMTKYDFTSVVEWQVIEFN